MKHNLLLLPFLAFMAMPQAQALEEIVSTPMVTVKGQFKEGDSLHYSIVENTWIVKGKDTVPDCSYVSYGVVTVDYASSHRNVLKWTCQSVVLNGSVNSYTQQALANMQADLKKNVVNQSVKFTVDENGAFVKWNGNDVVDAKIQNLNTAAGKQFAHFIDTDGQNRPAGGFGLVLLAEAADRFNLLERQMWVLENLFFLHGQSFVMGESQIGLDAQDTYTYAGYADAFNKRAQIETRNFFVDGGDEFGEFMGDVFLTPLRNPLLGQVRLQSVYNQRKRSGVAVSEHTSRVFCADGWPAKAVFDNKRMVAKVGKISQTTVTLVK